MADNPFGLRIATPDDAEALLAFVLPVFEESAAQAVSIPKVASLVLRCTEHDRAIAGIVTGEGNTIEASIGATIETFNYSDEPHLMVQWLGVAPAFRKSDRGARLTSFVHWLYDTMSAELDTPMPIFAGILTTDDQRPKVLLYQRRLPQVGVLHAFGCLPERTFFNPGRVGRKEGGARQSMKAAHVATPALATAS